MTFWDEEKSLSGGEPYELHEFRLGTTSTYWRYADAPADIEYDSHTFSADPTYWIHGGEIEVGSNIEKSRTVVKCDWRLPFAWQYTTMIPAYPIAYRRYKAHGSDVQLIFVGEVSSVVFRQQSRQGDRHAEINIDPPKASMKNAMGLISRYSRQCTVPLYSDRCGVNRDSYNQTGTLDDVDGNVLTDTVFGGEANGYFDGGDIIVNDYPYKVIEHIGNDVTVVPFPYGIEVGDSFDIAPGCDHIDDCNDRFSNRVNKKAQPNIPDDDFWSSDALFKN